MQIELVALLLRDFQGLHLVLQKLQLHSLDVFNLALNGTARLVRVSELVETVCMLGQQAALLVDL